MTAWESDQLRVSIDPEQIEDCLMHDRLASEIVRSTSDAIVAEDLSGRVMFWNEGAEDLYGHTAEEALGLSMRAFALPGQKGEDGAMAERARAGERPAPFLSLHRSASGEALMLSITSSPLRDASDGLIGVSHVMRRVAFPSPAPAAAEVEEYDVATRPGILIVDDEYIIGMGLATTLENAGFEVIGPAGSVDEAMALLEKRRCSLAILDVRLGREETSEPLARHLKDQGIPFFVTSGYLSEQRPHALRGVPSFSKPVGARTILAAVQSILF